MKAILWNRRNLIAVLILLLPGGFIVAPLLWLFQHIRSRKSWPIASSLLVGIAIIAGCATTPTGGASVSNRGAYPGCRDASYSPNADCYGGPP